MPLTKITGGEFESSSNSGLIISGIVTSTGFSGNLTGNSTGTHIGSVNAGSITINSSNNTISGIATAGITTAYVVSVNDGPISGTRNRIINGGMVVDQRNNGSSQTVTSGTTAYTLDRWLVYSAGSNMIVQRTGSIGSYSLQLTGAAGNSGSQVIQRIESHNISDLAGQIVTLSFTISSTTITSMGVFCATPTVIDNYTSINSVQTISGSVPVTTTPTRLSYSFTLPSSTTNGIQIFFQLASFTSGTLSITNVQLEQGTIATPFERRSIQQELAMCQRYYQEIGGNGGQNDVPYIRYTSTLNEYAALYPLVVSMRGQPNITTLTVSPSNIIHKPGVRWDTISSITWDPRPNLTQCNHIYSFISPATNDAGSTALYLFGQRVFASSEL